MCAMAHTTLNLLLSLLSAVSAAMASPAIGTGAQPEASVRALDSCRAWILRQSADLVKPILQVVTAKYCNTSSRHRGPPVSKKTCEATTNWPGFENIKYIFSFGDSYTTTEFRWAETPVPSLPDLPLGNPEEPRPPFHTSSNGPNWIEFLTTKYNRSELLTYNLAKGGATVVLRPGESDTRYSLPGQVEDIFIPGYASGTNGSAPAPRPDWNARNTLFAIWLGINDVNGSFFRGRGVTEALNKKIIQLYAKELEKLLDYGARNLVLLNVPALERAPLILEQGRNAVAMMAEDLREFNILIKDMGADFKAKHEGVNVWLYDSYQDFTTVVEEPKYFEQTKNIKNVSDSCDAYWPPTWDRDAFKPECGVPVSQYLWYSSLHPGYAMHEVVADQVAKLLGVGPNIC